MVHIKKRRVSEFTDSRFFSGSVRLFGVGEAFAGLIFGFLTTLDAFE